MSIILNEIYWEDNHSAFSGYIGDPNTTELICSIDSTDIRNGDDERLYIIYMFGIFEDCSCNKTLCTLEDAKVLITKEIQEELERLFSRFVDINAMVSKRRKRIIAEL
jgi:hypothetical protein